MCVGGIRVVANVHLWGVNSYGTCPKSTLASHVNDGCTCTGDQLSMHVCWGSTLAYMYVRD